MNGAIDPYEILGVAKDADTAAIRNAYRRAAKSAHPDGGGSEKKFELIKLAHDVLSDAERRAKYDATGSFDPKEPDNAMADVLNVIMGALSGAIQAAEQEGTRPEQRDLVAMMKTVISRGTTERVQKRQQLLDAEKKIRKLQSRFKTKKSAVNFIENMLSQSLAAIAPQLQQLDRFDIAAKAATEMLKDYTFTSEAIDTYAMQNIARAAFLQMGNTP